MLATTIAVVFAISTAFCVVNIDEARRMHSRAHVATADMQRASELIEQRSALTRLILTAVANNDARAETAYLDARLELMGTLDAAAADAQNADARRAIAQGRIAQDALTGLDRAALRALRDGDQVEATELLGSARRIRFDAAFGASIEDYARAERAAATTELSGAAEAHAFNQFIAVSAAALAFLAVLAMALHSMRRLSRERARSVILEQSAARNAEDSEAAKHFAFQQNPTPTTISDFSAARRHLMELKLSGVTDLAAHFEDNPSTEAVLARACSILDVNEAFLELSGAPNAEFVDKHSSGIHRSDSLPTIRDFLIGALDGQTSFVGPAAIYTKDRQRRAVDLMFKAAPGAEHDLSRVWGYYFDRTAEHNAEEARSTAELSARRHRSELARRSARLKTQLRAPAAAAFAAIDALERAVTNDDRETHLDESRASVRRLVNLVEDFTELAQLDGVQVDLQRAPFGLHNVLDDVYSRVEGEARANDVALTFNVSQKAHGAYLGDATRLRQIISVLVESAVRRSRNGAVEVGLTRNEDDEGAEKLLVSVHYSGAPIPSHTLDLYLQSDVSDPAYDQVVELIGDGPVLAKRLVDAIGADLWTENDAEGTIVFQFEFPVEAWEGEIEANHFQDGPSLGAAHRLAPGLRALAIEDAAGVGMILRALLAQTGVETASVSDVASASELAARSRCDLIFIEADMLCTQDAAAIAALRNAARRSDAAIIALSSDTDMDVLVRLEEAGADGVVELPIKPDAFFKCVQRALAAPHRNERDVNADAGDDADGDAKAS